MVPVNLEAELRLLDPLLNDQERATLKRYFNTELHPLGIRVPQLRQFTHQIIKTSSHSIPDQLKMWEELWFESSIWDALTASLFYLDYLQSKIDHEQHWPIVLRWLPRVDNWGHSDGFSKLIARAMEQHPELVYPQLKAWNQSSNPWERRQSIVGLLDYAKLRRRYPTAEQMLQLLTPLLKDPHPYVQKGLGWTLREFGQIYPKEHRDFLETHITILSAIAFSAATEKILPEFKAALKLRRKR